MKNMMELKRKQKNVIDSQGLKLKETLVRQKEEREKIMNFKRNQNNGGSGSGSGNGSSNEVDAYDPLARFQKKSK